MSSNFDNSILELMKAHGMDVPFKKKMINIEGAKEIMQNALSYFLSIRNEKAVWLPEYDKVAEWLSDNEGKGLLLFGSCGLGKTFLVRYVIPAILLKYKNMVVKYTDIQQVNKNIDAAMNTPIIAIDDIGIEELHNEYGNKRLALYEVLDMAEKKGNLVICTSNLGGQDLLKKYGERVYERIYSTMKRVAFNGESLRKL